MAKDYEQIRKAKQEDQPIFNVLELKNMKCANCKYCTKDIMECDIYERKPDGVLEGGECSEFEEKTN